MQSGISLLGPLPSSMLCAFIAPVLIILAGCSAAERESGCEWRIFPVKAAQPDRREYIGRGQHIELRVPNERTDQEPDVFPESPMRIHQLSASGSCEIP